MRNPTFRQIIEEVTRTARVRQGLKPISLVSLCKKWKISRPSLYNALTGSAAVGEKAIAKLAKGLDMEPAAVQAAIEKQRAIAEMSK